MTSPPTPPFALSRVAFAWFVHIFTMTGVAWACLAIVALFNGEIAQMWLWLGIALIVDGVDGTLARTAEVKKYTPNFDGTSLDILIDYLTWTFIPALFMYLYVPFGAQWVAGAMFVLICTSSVLCYCNLKLKTPDNYFMGFPAAWNVVAVSMWVLGTGPVLNVIATVVLAILTVSPLTFVHPFRVSRLMPVNVAAAFLWIGATAALVWLHPERGTAVELPWWLSGGWLMLLSAIRTIQEIAKRRSGTAA